MGSQYKRAILEEHTVHAIKQWHANVRRKRKMDGGPSIQETSTSASTAAPWTSSSTGSASADFSSHRRHPNFMEFANAGGVNGEDEIVEDLEIHLQNVNPSQNQEA